VNLLGRSAPTAGDMADWGGVGKLGKDSQRFFFEKKKQKTFYYKGLQG
jgi:hypothetical protein